MLSPATAQERLITQDRAFAAFLAALVDRGVADISGQTSSVHRSFAAALSRLRTDEKLAHYFEHYYASRGTGHVEEFERALIRGELTGFVHYGNPTYSRIRVSLAPAEVDALLSEFEDSRNTLAEAADAFIERLTHDVW